MRELARLVADAAAAWNRFWFTPADVAALASIRMATGLLLLYVYGSCTPSVLSYLGPHAWVDAATIEQLRGPAAGAASRWWGQSVWFYVQAPAAVWAGHVVFLFAIACFTVGFWTRTANAVVWVGHLSFVHRAYFSWSGLDTVLAMLTFYLLLAPAGAAFALDRRRAGPAASWTANLALRLIQIHMCIIYLCAGLGKLQGPRWWDGTAVWQVLMLSEFAPFDVSWLGRLGDDACLLLSNLGVLCTLGLEVSFVFLIWNGKARPVLLGLAVLLHAGIGFFMGMVPFGAAMLTGCLAFVPAETHRRSLAAFARTLARLPGLRCGCKSAAPGAPVRRAA